MSRRLTRGSRWRSSLAKRAVTARTQAMTQRGRARMKPTKASTRARGYRARREVAIARAPGGRNRARARDALAPRRRLDARALSRQSSAGRAAAAREEDERTSRA